MFNFDDNQELSLFDMPHASTTVSPLLASRRPNKLLAPVPVQVPEVEEEDSTPSWPSRTACEILAEALAGDARVDFPMVTEICELTRTDSLELTMLTGLLASVLGSPSGKDLSRQLKAVTVAHELLYDESARKALAAAPGLLDSLRCLQVAATSAIGGSPAAEGVYLLASETLRQLTLTVPASPLGKSMSLLRKEEDRGWLQAFEDFLADIPIA